MAPKIQKRFAKQNDIPLDVPWSELTPEQREMIFDGDPAKRGYPGVRCMMAAVAPAE